jgi:hypothetical protein
MAADAGAPAQPPRAAPVSSVEITFATHAGEGAARRKRFLGQARAPLRPRSRMGIVADRFGAEMQALSPACATADAR